MLQQRTCCVQDTRHLIRYDDLLQINMQTRGYAATTAASAAATSRQQGVGRQSTASLSMAAAATDAKLVRVAILGASGYTGAELVRLLLGHTGVEIAVLTGNTQAGQAFSTVYPQFHYAKVNGRNDEGIMNVRLELFATWYLRYATTFSRAVGDLMLECLVNVDTSASSTSDVPGGAYNMCS